MTINRQQGFTIIEVVIAITLVGALAALVSPMFASTADASHKYETERRLKDLKQTILAGYRHHAFEIDSEPGAEVMVDGKPVLANDTLASASSFSWAESYASQSTVLLSKDGYGKAWRIYVSNRLSNVVNGNAILSHKIALVSEGRNGRFDSGTTFDPVTGALTLAGDDVGEVIDGFDVQRQLYEVTAKRLDQLAKAYEAYFLTRYQSNPERGLNINYFVNGSRAGVGADMFDTGGTVTHTDGGDAPAAVLFESALGLAGADYVDGYGNPILVDNSSDAVRSPDNSITSMQRAPFTAVVKARMPGNTFIAQSVIGSY